MKKIYFLLISISLFIATEKATAQSFSWSSYVTGATSYSASNSGVTMTVAVTGSGFSTGFPTYVAASGGYLNVGVDWANRTTNVKYTITFSKAVSGATFLLYDVDQTSTWDDKITVDGVNQENAAVYPVITGNSYTTISGTNSNIIEGKSDNPTFLNSPAKVDFGVKLMKTITITYSAGSSSPSNPVFQTIGFGTITFNNVLPIDLLSFKAEKRNSNTDISWKTENMVNFSHFEVECSANTTNAFKSIATVSSNNSTDGTYIYTDVNAKSRMNKAFYRLKMVDIDGNFKYSSVMMVSFEGMMVVDVRPTLLTAGGAITVNISGTNAGKCDVRMFDLSGRMVQQKSQVNGLVKLETTSLNKGIYIIQVIDGTAPASFRVCLQ